MIDELKKLADMLSQGQLSQEDFDTAKAKILNSNQQTASAPTQPLSSDLTIPSIPLFFGNPFVCVNIIRILIILFFALSAIECMVWLLAQDQLKYIAASRGITFPKNLSDQEINANIAAVCCSIPIFFMSVFVYHGTFTFKQWSPMALLAYWIIWLLIDFVCSFFVFRYTWGINMYLSNITTTIEAFIICLVLFSGASDLYRNNTPNKAASL